MLRVITVKRLFVSIAFGLAVSSNCAAAPDKVPKIYQQARELTPNLENGKEVYAICAACHLKEGWGLKDGTYPQIAGQYKQVLIQQLSDIHAHNRDNPTMYPFSLPEAIGDAQDIADVVGYIEKMRMTSDNGKGEWEEDTPEFTKGKQLYTTYCTECHGENGAGYQNKLFPRIDGQHYNYLLRQLEWMRDGKRRSVDHDMLKNINTFTERGLALVANYISRLPVTRQNMSQ
jgi:cytochrome c553